MLVMIKITHHSKNSIKSNRKKRHTSSFDSLAKLLTVTPATELYLGPLTSAIEQEEATKSEAVTEMTERGRGKENVSSSNNSESIQVVVRLRPENEKDKNRYGKHCVSLTSEKSISLFRPLNSNGIK